MKTLLFFSLLAFQVVDAQQHFLISPNQKIIPLKPYESASLIIERMTHKQATSDSCTDGRGIIWGFPEDLYPPNAIIPAYHKDVLGEWFVSQAKGTIDTIFWLAGPRIGAVDSNVIVRIHRSIIGHTYGPGVRPGPFDPPCQNWGYWININDLDGGIAPFGEDAFPLPGTFQSTNPEYPAGPPFAEELWGNGGFPVVMHANAINHVALMDMGVACSLTVGEPFFISIAPKSPPILDSTDSPTDFVSTDFHTLLTPIYPTLNQPYPSRNWKFFEHDSGLIECGNLTSASIKKGWIAQGGLTPESTDVMIYNWWYSMTISTNTAPTITENTILHNRDARERDSVFVTLTDCDPPHPGFAGIDTAFIDWWMDGHWQPSVGLTETTGGMWYGVIPRPDSGNHVIDYFVDACDSGGLCTTTSPHEYQTVDLRNDYYVVDTLSSCQPHSIASSGTVVPPSAFFNEVGGMNPADDGQAGPFRIPGGPMNLFGDTVSYVWIGVDGAIALSKQSDDTLDLTSNGAYCPGWTFPSAQRHGRSDINGKLGGLPPKNFIAPFYKDLYYADSARQYGAIRFGPDEDSCSFVVEWDSLAGFNNGVDPSYAPTFRAVLDRCDGTIAFEYELVNKSSEGDAIDPAALVGMQADSNSVTAGYAAAEPGYVFINKGGRPIQSTPRSGTCIQFTPGAPFYARAGWNLLSVSHVPKGGNYSFANLYPGAKGPFFYRGADGYKYTNWLSHCVGFWGKFSNRTYAGTPGYPITSRTDTIFQGWNIIATISSPLKTSQITGINATWSPNFFSYDGSGYVLASTLLPGQGYWVKAVQTGADPRLILEPSTAVQKSAAQSCMDVDQLCKITLRNAAGGSQTLYLGSDQYVHSSPDNFEMPPSAFDVSGFDARFSSGRMLETYPSAISPSARSEYPITIQTNAYPLTVTLKPFGTSMRGINAALRTTAGGLLGSFRNGSGMVTVRNSSVQKIVLVLNDRATLPSVFALYQNYPNPFNPSTEIRYDLPYDSYIKLLVYDILGRKVVSLIDGFEEAGERSVHFDASTFSSGVYFYALTSGSFHQTRKLLLIK
ncbi:MAG TPA: T9SS type A sorting domain-containing protein [Bacteroidota bacterium]|nr:T9SS type A sorting domain-containing protein [Bacteroidota bacterium]